MRTISRFGLPGGKLTKPKSLVLDILKHTVTGCWVRPFPPGIAETETHGVLLVEHDDQLEGPEVTLEIVLYPHHCQENIQAGLVYAGSFGQIPELTTGYYTPPHGPTVWLCNKVVPVPYDRDQRPHALTISGQARIHVHNYPNLYLWNALLVEEEEVENIKEEPKDGEQYRVLFVPFEQTPPVGYRYVGLCSDNRVYVEDGPWYAHGLCPEAPGLVERHHLHRDILVGTVGATLRLPGRRVCLGVVQPYVRSVGGELLSCVVDNSEGQVTEVHLLGFGHPIPPGCHYIGSYPSGKGDFTHVYADASNVWAAALTIPGNE